jgi:hypothetical protein
LRIATLKSGQKLKEKLCDFVLSLQIFDRNPKGSFTLTKFAAKPQNNATLAAESSCNVLYSIFPQLNNLLGIIFNLKNIFPSLINYMNIIII